MTKSKYLVCFDVPIDYDVEGKDKDDPDAAIISEYRAKGRFEPNRENQAIVDAKYKAMQVVDLLLNLEFNSRLEVNIYSHVETGFHNFLGNRQFHL